MKDNGLYLAIVEHIHNIINSQSFLRKSVRRKADFSRERKAGFTDYMYKIIGNLKSSLQAALNTFFTTVKNPL